MYGMGIDSFSDSDMYVVPLCGLPPSTGFFYGHNFLMLNINPKNAVILRVKKPKNAVILNVWSFRRRI